MAVVNIDALLGAPGFDVVDTRDVWLLYQVDSAVRPLLDRDSGVIPQVNYNWQN